MSDGMIIRIQSSEQNVEVAKRDSLGNMKFKTIKISQLSEIINEIASQIDSRRNIKLCNDEVIGYGNNCAIIRQKSRKRIVMFKSGKKTKAYNINFPNAIYIVCCDENSIKYIEMYAYKEYKDEDTKLFEYPMPNELSGNKLCIGSAPRTIINGNVVKSLETIIFTPYSHDNFSGVKGFSKSEKWFEYLSKNEFPYKLLKSLNMKLGDTLK